MQTELAVLIIRELQELSHKHDNKIKVNSTLAQILPNICIYPNHRDLLSKHRYRRVLYYGKDGIVTKDLPN